MFFVGSHLASHHVFSCGGHFCGIDIDHVDECRLGSAQRHLVAEYAVFYRILERRVEEDTDDVSLHKPHFYEPLPESAVSVDFDDYCFRPCLEFGKFHSCILYECKITMFAADSNTLK